MVSISARMKAGDDLDAQRTHLDGAEQPRLNLAPGRPHTRFRLSIRETPIKFRPLLFREGQRRPILCDAIPDILDELDTLGDTELSDFRERIGTHS